MTNRELYLDYIKNGGDRMYCSVQIGAGAGYELGLAGKTWFSDGTPQDIINAYRRYDMLPLYNYTLMDLAELTDSMHWEELEHTKTEHSQTWKRRLVTPKGSLENHVREDEGRGSFQTKFLVTEDEDLDLLEYYLDALLELGDKDFAPVEAYVRNCRQIFGEDDPVDIQWAMQPYELLCFPDTCNTAIFASVYPEQFKRLMDKVLRLDEKLLPQVAKGGADFVFLGGPGSEMISPKYYENFLVPYSKIVTDMAHANGLMIYSHICSPIEPMLTMGYYNQMGIDLFETLSEPPVGNVQSIEDAFSKLSPDICTRGNIGLDALLNEEPAQIKERCFKVLEAAKKMGRKHLLGASDYLFYGTKEENVIAMCEAVQEFNGKN